MVPYSPALDTPYEGKMLRLIADAQRYECHLIHLRLSGWWLISKENPSNKGTRFAVEGNRLRLLPGLWPVKAPADA